MDARKSRNTYEEGANSEWLTFRAGLATIMDVDPEDIAPWSRVLVDFDCDSIGTLEVLETYVADSKLDDVMAKVDDMGWEALDASYLYEIWKEGRQSESDHV